MGILETVIGSLFGGPNNTSSGMGGVLSGLLGGAQRSSGAQGLGGIVSQFQQAGLGNLVQSWIGNGSNQPVSPSQLQNVFGDRVPGMASQAGMDQGDFLSQLSQHLPNAINGMTPNGRIDDNGSVNV